MEAPLIAGPGVFLTEVAGLQDVKKCLVHLGLPEMGLGGSPQLPILEVPPSGLGDHRLSARGRRVIPIGDS